MEPGELNERRGPQGAFKVTMEFDLGSLRKPRLDLFQICEIQHDLTIGDDCFAQMSAL